MMTTTERMTKAKVRLMLTPFAWYGSLAINLTYVEDASIPTLCTDGTTLRYSPTFVESLTDPELFFGVAHEVSHCAFRHMYESRNNGRDPDLWNQAGDFAINFLLKDSGFSLPDGVLYDAKYAGMSAEEIYAALQQEQQQHDLSGGGQPQDGQGSHKSPCFVPAGTFSDPNEPNAPTPITETEWQVMADQAAMQARRAGQMGAELARAIERSREAVLDWKTILRRFIEQTIPSDYSWTTPNRRYLGIPMYLPGQVKQNTPRIAVAIDTSGSITQDMLSDFAAELTDIVLEVRPTAVDVIYCDAQVNGVETFTPDDGEIVLEAKGGGGTAFQPVFDWVEEQDEAPACMIYATDLECWDIPQEPEYPVLWLTPEWVRMPEPFGERVSLPKRP